MESAIFYPKQCRLALMLGLMMMTTMILSANHVGANLVLSDHIMALTVEAAKLSILAYDETEPDDTVTHDYTGTSPVVVCVK
jgi:hypothetical protein